MFRLIVFLIEIILAAVLGGILGYAANPGRPRSRVQALVLLTVGAAVIAGVSSGFSDTTVGSPQGILIAGIIISTGLLAAGFLAREDNSSRRLLTIASFWMAATVGILVGVGSLIRAILLTGLAYYVLRYLPDVFHRQGNSQSSEENES